MTDLTHIEQIITRALLEGCDNHKTRAQIARETARQVMEVVAAPIGWKLLPADPTPEMRAAGQQVLRSCGYGAVTTSDLWPVYRVMLAAAPDAPSVTSAPSPSPSPSYEDGIKEGLQRAAGLAYAICAQTRHVKLGQQAEAAILSLLTKEEGR